MSTTYVRVEPAASAAVTTRHQARTPRPDWRWLSSGVWLTVGLITVWAACYLLFISGLEHARSQHQLYAHFRAQAAQAYLPVGGVIAPGTPVAMISAGRTGLHDEVVVEGTAASQLRGGPGHLRTTPLPGQPGVSLLYGRSVSFGGPFGDVSALRAGDPISVVTGQGKFVYRVSDVRHAGDQVATLAAGGSRLTLVSSTASGWRSGWAPNQVVYVDATLQGDSQPDPGGRPTSLSPAEKLMAHQVDTSTLVKVILWLQLLLVSAAVLSWAQVRWGRMQSWLTGAPIILAALWGLSNSAVALLPNLL
jgi:sortase A